MAEKVKNVVNEKEQPVELYVKYVGGSGLTLEYALSDGTRVIRGHEPILIAEYSDFVRLMSSPNDFVECDSNGNNKGK